MNTTPNRWRSALAALAAACALVACGGGGGTAPVPATVPDGPTPVAIPVAAEVTAPALNGNVAIDGKNWINYRRAQAGVAMLPSNPLIERAAQAHSDYQKLNNVIAHDEIAGNAGFTGVDLLKRLNSAGYSFAANSYAYGEVISAVESSSGPYMVDELVTAIYHRFVIFEPMFKELGTGSATTSKNYTYFTTDFTANDGYGAGIGRGALVTWPYSGQTKVTPNFFSDNEKPDPVANANEVGYPVSVHADISAVLAVQSFTLRPRGGANLAVKLLQHSADPSLNDHETPDSAAAIVPLAPLRGATTYDATFIGTIDGILVAKTWSFITK